MRMEFQPRMNFKKPLEEKDTRETLEKINEVKENERVNILSVFFE